MSEQDTASEREALEVRVIALLTGELPEAEADELEEVLSRDEELSAFRDQMATLIGGIHGARDEISPPLEAAAPMHLSDAQRCEIFENEVPLEGVSFKQGAKKWWHLGLLEMAAIFIVGGLFVSVIFPTIKRVRFFAEEAQVQDDVRALELELPMAERSEPEPALLMVRSLRSKSPSESRFSSEVLPSAVVAADDQADRLMLEDDSMRVEKSSAPSRSKEGITTVSTWESSRGLAHHVSAEAVSASDLTRNKLDCIVIPQVNFSEMPIADLVRSLHELSSAYASGCTGINLVALLPADDSTRISLKLKDATIRDILAQVSQLSGAKLIEADDVVILRKLDTVWMDLGERDARLQAIVIPQVSFVDQPLSELVDLLERLSVEYDPQRKGIQMSYESVDGVVPHVSMQLSNLGIDRIIQLITQQIGYEFSIDGDRIHIQPAKASGIVPDGSQ